MISLAEIGIKHHYQIPSKRAIKFKLNQQGLQSFEQIFASVSSHLVATLYNGPENGYNIYIIASLLPHLLLTSHCRKMSKQVLKHLCQYLVQDTMACQLND